MNIPGYGPSRPWEPPIKTPETIIAIFDRYELTETWQALPFIVAFTSWLDNFGSGDSWDGYWYNNAKASGDQLYPKGLSKYFDVHSTSGLFEYMFYWIWVTIELAVSPMTLSVPVDVWLALFNGASTEGLWKIFLFYMPFSIVSLGTPTLIAKFFGVKMEDGWGILDN